MKSLSTIKTKWSIDNTHSEVSFVVKHLMITKVKGLFREYGATIYTNGNGFLTADVNFWLNPASVDTRDAKRDEHIKAADFFDVERFKLIKFKGTSLEKTDNIAAYELFGDLTIKDITKQIQLGVKFDGAVKDPWGNEKVGFSIIGKINRKTWGLNWNTVLETGGVLVSEDVLIKCELQLIKQ